MSDTHYHISAKMEDCDVRRKKGRVSTHIGEDGGLTSVEKKLGLAYDLKNTQLACMKQYTKVRDIPLGG